MARYIKLNTNNIKQFMNSFDTVLTDCDGVLWNGPHAIPGAPETFVKLKQLGKRIFPVTNNSTKTRAEYVNKCLGMGYPVEKEDIIGSAYVTAQYIKDDLNYKGKIYMIGSTGLYQELTAVGYEVEGMNEPTDLLGMKDLPNIDVVALANMPLDPEVKCVVVGFCQSFNFARLARACSYLQQHGSLFVATNTDAALPMGDKILPGTGSLVAAVKVASGREPDLICGKPNKPIYDVAHEKHNVDKENTIMIGDRLNTDIELAHNCGLVSLHVLTGVHKEEDVHKLLKSESDEDKKMIPHYYIESLGHLGQLIDSISNGS